MSSSNNNNNAAVEEPATKLSEYEEARARNIEKNNARLRSLGLISALEEKQSNDLAWGRQPTYESEDEDFDSSSDEEYSEEGTTSKKKRKKRSKTSTPREGSRKSRRLLGLTSDGNTLDKLKDESEEQRKERIQQEREEMVIECREARLRAANEVAKAGHQLAGTKNPTATYEHCLMRVRTMNEKGLMNRVKAIERAAGKHCVVKMAIFKSCLQDEDMWELASLANDALERLKALLPPP